MPFSVGALHRVCAAVHFVSASLLLIVLAAGEHSWSEYNRPVSKSFMTPSQWRYVCWNNATKSYDKKYNCVQKYKQWYITLPESHGEFDTMFQTATAAVFFSYFSSLCHFVAMIRNRAPRPATLWQALAVRNLAFKPLKDVEYKDEIVVRTIDYIGTAPVMMALFNVLWNANNVAGVILAPIVLAFVIVGAFAVSYIVCSKHDVPAKYGIFMLLAAIYVTFLFIGTINALISQSSSHNENGETPRGLTLYPPGVVAASSFVLVTFSSFVVPYVFELKDGPAVQLPTARKPQVVATLASMWAAMSLVAKIMLLIAFGAGTQVQTDMLKNRTHATAPPTTTFSVNTVVVAVGAVIVAAGIAFFAVVRTKLKHAAALQTTGTETGLMEKLLNAARITSSL